MIILYLIESSLYLLMGWALYTYAFRERAWFRFSRLFLLSWIPISLLAPLIPWATLWTISGGEYIVYLEEITIGSSAQTVADPSNSSIGGLSWIWVLLGVLYFGGVIYKIVDWLRGHQSILQLKNNALLWEKNNADNLTIYRWAGSMPFSYGRYIFIPKSLEVNSSEYQMTLNHEKVHVQEKHYIDKVYYHLWAVFLWFHPLVYIMRQAQEEVHELEADRAVTERFQKQHYMHFLLQEAQGLRMANPHLVSPFFTSPLKKRIQMIAGQTQPQSRTTILLLLGLFFIAGITFIGCESEVTDNVQELEQQSKNGTVYYLDGMRAQGEENSSTPPPPPPPPPPSPEALKNINTIAATAAGVSSEQEGKEIFKVVEHMPRFPGCEKDPLSYEERKQCAQQKLLEFVYEHIRYPETARAQKISGMVVVKFVVDHEGRVQNPEIVRDIGGGCGEEAVRVVQLMHDRDIRWVSGKQRGQNVSVQFNLPVKFQFE